MYSATLNQSVGKLSFYFATQQLFLLLAPHLLEKDEAESLTPNLASDAALNHIDPNIFKTSVRQLKANTTRTPAQQ